MNTSLELVRVPAEGMVVVCFDEPTEQVHVGRIQRLQRTARGLGMDFCMLISICKTEPTIFSHMGVLLDADIILVIQRKNSLGIGKMNYYRIKEVPVMIEHFAHLDFPLSLNGDD